MSRNPPATASFSTEQSNFDAVRKEWIKKQLKTREGQFTQSFSIKFVLVDLNPVAKFFSACTRAINIAYHHDT
jgi:hypothetical protein